MTRASKPRFDQGESISDPTKSVSTASLPALNLPTLPAALAKSGRSSSSAVYSPSSSNLFKRYGLPQRLLKEFKATSTPSSLISKSTRDLVNLLEQAQTSAAPVRRFIVGKRSSKSTLLLQAVDWAASNGWLVLYIPFAVRLVDGSLSYSLSGSEGSYHQPELAKELIDSFLAVNAKALKDSPLEGRLKDLLVSNGRPFSAFLDMVSSQTELPLLVAVDSAQALYRQTAYYDASGSALDSFRLAIPNGLLRLMQQPKAGHKGAILFATSQSDPCFQSRPLDIALGLQTAHSAYDSASRSPYAAFAKGIKTFEVAPLQMNEAGKLMQVLHDLKLLARPLADERLLANLVQSNGRPDTFAQSLRAVA